MSVLEHSIGVQQQQLDILAALQTQKHAKSALKLFRLMHTVGKLLHHLVIIVGVLTSMLLPGGLFFSMSLKSESSDLNAARLVWRRSWEDERLYEGRPGGARCPSRVVGAMLVMDRVVCNYEVNLLVLVNRSDTCA
jgi:hypothetical protein